MGIKYDTLDDFLKAFGLECADDTEKKLIEDVALNTDKIDFKIGRKRGGGTYAMIPCMQNYFIIRQLTLQKNELLQNNALCQQIIEQNNTLVEQNKQIIALLTKISEK